MDKMAVSFGQGTIRLFEINFFHCTDEQVQEGVIMAHVNQVLNREIQQYEGLVYQPFSIYFQGVHRGGSVTLKRYRWQFEQDIDMDHFQQEVSILR